MTVSAAAYDVFERTVISLTSGPSEALTYTMLFSLQIVKDKHLPEFEFNKENWLRLCGKLFDDYVRIVEVPKNGTQSRNQD